MTTHNPEGRGRKILAVIGLGIIALAASDCTSREEQAPTWPLILNDPESPVESWEATEVLRIGSLEGEADAFGDIGGLAIDSAGRIYLIDWQIQDLRLFSADGRFLRQVAGRGEGPEEIAGAAGVSVDAHQNVWIWDVRLGRFAVFDSSGVSKGTVRRKETGSPLPWVGRFDEQGFLYDTGLSMDGEDQTVLVARLDPEAKSWKRLSPLKGTMDMTSSGVRRPMSGILMVGVDPKGNRWVGHQREARFWKVNLEGDTVLEAVIDADREGLEARKLDSLRRIPWGPEGQRLEDQDMPRKRLAFRKFWVGAEGRLFVARATGDSLENRLFDVLDPQGVLIAQLKTPVPLETAPIPQVHGPYLYGTTKDDLGVEYFVRFRIHRP